MKTAIFIIVSIILAMSATGQQIDHDVKTVKRIFRNNAKGTTFDWKKKDWDKTTNHMYLLQHDGWTTCDTDSSYFKSDTIVLYNHGLAYLDFDCCCQLMSWWLHAGNKMTYVKKKPPMSTVYPDLLKINVFKDEDVTKINLEKDKKVEESFTVLSLEKTVLTRQDDPMYVMTLKRNN